MCVPGTAEAVRARLAEADESLHVRRRPEPACGAAPPGAGALAAGG